MTKKRQRVYDKIYKMNDFPVFKYWNHNTKEFEARALNKLSTRFIFSLAYDIEKLREGSIEELHRDFIDAVKYAYFFNASYETSGPNSFCGGDDSIQEQFVCWALNIAPAVYREKRSLAFSEELFTSSVVREWLEKSELYKLFLKEQKRGKLTRYRRILNKAREINDIETMLYYADLIEKVKKEK